MADGSSRKEQPQYSRPEDHHQLAHAHSHPHHHAPPYDHQRASHTPTSAPRAAPPPNMAASVTLPSIHDSRGGYGPPSGPPRGYPADPRFASPHATNGYPPPGQPAQHQHQHQHQLQHRPHPPPPAQQSQPPPSYLPPLQPQSGHGDQRPPAYPPPDQRPGYYDDRHAPPAPHPHPPPYGQEQQYASDPYYGYRGAPPQAPPPGNYRDYRAHLASGVYEYPPTGPGAAPQLNQAAPRQRTSIACRYCRKRKIRCSGYQSAPGEKCQNCARMNQECIFQPVSSSSSTAFIPVSAVPGGVPPGTQLFGAYGQPLAPGTVAGTQPPPAAAPPPGAYPPHSAAPAPAAPMPPAANYYAPVQSPTESYASYEARGDDGPQVVPRRRRRSDEDREEGFRLPPPRSTMEDDPRRRSPADRSPAEYSNTSSPGGLAYPYPGARQSPRNPPASVPPQQVHQQAPGVGYAAPAAPGSRSPAVQNGSSGASTPARQPPTNGQQSQNNASVMSLSNLVDKPDNIDRTMIDRLNRTREPGPGQNGARQEQGR